VELFGHNTQPCAHQWQEGYIVLCFGLALTKMIMEKVSVRFDLFVTEYRRTWGYVEMPPDPTLAEGGSAQEVIFQASSSNNRIQVECTATQQVFASTEDFRLHCQRMTQEELMDMMGSSEDGNATWLHVSQPLFFRAWFVLLCSTTTVLILGLTLADIDVEKALAPIALNLAVSVWLVLTVLYSLCLWFGKRSEDAARMEAAHSTGVVPLLWTAISVLVIITGVAEMRDNAHSSKTDEAQAATWLIVLLCFLQLVFVRVQGTWLNCGMEYHKANMEYLDETE